jgi:hypothetical protein
MTLEEIVIRLKNILTEADDQQAINPNDVEAIEAAIKHFEDKIDRRWDNPSYSSSMRSNTF